MSLQLGNYPDPAASVPFHYGHADLRKTSGCVQTRPDVNSDDPIGGHFDLTASDVIDQIALFMLGDAWFRSASSRNSSGTRSAAERATVA